jgi:hypothetical protein
MSALSGGSRPSDRSVTNSRAPRFASRVRVASRQTTRHETFASGDAQAAHHNTHTSHSHTAWKPRSPNAHGTYAAQTIGDPPHSRPPPGKRTATPAQRTGMLIPRGSSQPPGLPAEWPHGPRTSSPLSPPAHRLLLARHGMQRVREGLQMAAHGAHAPPATRGERRRVSSASRPHRPPRSQ